VQDCDKQSSNSAARGRAVSQEPEISGRDAENARRFLTIDSWDNASAYRARREFQEQ
jgi:hypothetical protein